MIVDRQPDTPGVSRGPPTLRPIRAHRQGEAGLHETDGETISTPARTHTQTPTVPLIKVCLYFHFLSPPKAVLINVSRGLVVHEESLYNALVSGVIRAAVIDTWWRYPEPPLGKQSTSAVHPSEFPFHELVAQGKVSQCCPPPILSISPFSAFPHSQHFPILSISPFSAFPHSQHCLLYTSPSPRDRQKSRMPSSA